jgi:hypothetical protein
MMDVNIYTTGLAQHKSGREEKDKTRNEGEQREMKGGMKGGTWGFPDITSHSVLLRGRFCTHHCYVST